MIRYTASASPTILGTLLCTLLLSLGFAATASQANAANARMKGLSVISQELSSRIAPTGTPIDLSSLMPGEGLETLAGTWLPRGSGYSFQNGEPNAVNMVLLRLTFARFAKRISESCESAKLPLNDHFYDALAALCDWPSQDAQSEGVMQDFWLYLMGYSADKSEYVAWRDFIRSTYGSKNARESIEAMTLSLMLNPYFLLQH